MGKGVPRPRPYRFVAVSIYSLATGVLFSIFWAMIIGDAGYGSLFLITTLALAGKIRKASPQLFGLLFTTSVCTIIWGAASGNWFAWSAFNEETSIYKKE